jgi:hypothetical protein
MIRPLPAVIAAALLSAACGQPVETKAYPDVDPARIQAHLDQFDQAEAAGMEAGGRGERLAVAYAKRVFTEIGVAVNTPSTPLTKILTKHAAVTLTVNGTSRTLVEGDEVVAWSHRHETMTTADGDMVFVGYGISAPRQGWDDYKNVDVRGKVLLMLIGSPMVGQRQLLGTVGGDLYGRSRYKFNEAERRGAVGVLLVHLEDRSDLTWDQIQEVHTEILDPGAPGQFTPHLSLEGWIHVDAAREIVSAAGLDFADLTTKAQQTNFTAMDIPVHAVAHVESEILPVTTTNVVATIPPVGAPAEYVMFSTQWNTLPAGHANGRDLTNGDPEDQGPPGASVLLEVARALSRARAPHGGFVFLIVTAEPQGLIGLDSYLENPPYAPAATRAAIHVVGFNDRHTDDRRLEIVGLGYETLKGMVREEAAEQYRIAESDFEPERLAFFREGRVAFTLKEIPSIFLSSAKTIDSKTAAAEPRDMSTAVLDVRLLFHLGMSVATANHWPAWEPSRTLLDYDPRAPQADGHRPHGIR